MKQSQESLLLLGLKNYKIVSINEVPNGLACECICPKCNGFLIAKNNGTKKLSHFAHKNNDTCIGSVESAIHLLAKEILFEERELFIPSYEVCFDKRAEPVELMKFNKLTKFDLVFYEQKFICGSDFMIADAVCIKSEKILLIEFAHSHFVEEKKSQLLKRLGHPCLEIDLTNASQIKNELKLQLKTGFFKTTWLVNKKGELKAEEYSKKLRQQKENALKKERLREKIKVPNFHILIKEKNYEELKKEAEKKGTITSKCPIKDELYMQYATTKYGNNDIIKKLLEGNWNGKIYEDKPNQFDLFINEQRYFISPENYNDLSDSEKLKCKELYDLILKFKEYKKDFFHHSCPCNYCNLFRGFFYNENDPKAQIICGYKKGLNTNQHYLFPPKPRSRY